MGVDAVVLLTVDELRIQFIRISRTVMAALCVFLLITVSIQTGEHSLNPETCIKQVGKQEKEVRT